MGGISTSTSISKPSGGDATGSGGRVAYSVGELVYTTNIGTTGSVSSGVQHAFEIYSIGINETANDILVTVFPNPTAESLIMRTATYTNEKLSYQLFDMQGNLLYKGLIVEQQTQINMTDLSAATYFLNVVNIHSFKIIKTQ